jgi:hypothetical protein
MVSVWLACRPFPDLDSISFAVWTIKPRGRIRKGYSSRQRKPTNVCVLFLRRGVEAAGASKLNENHFCISKFLTILDLFSVTDVALIQNFPPVTTVKTPCNLCYIEVEKTLLPVIRKLPLDTVFASVGEGEEREGVGLYTGSRGWQVALPSNPWTLRRE